MNFLASASRRSLLLLLTALSGFAAAGCASDSGMTLRKPKVVNVPTGFQFDLVFSDEGARSFIETEMQKENWVVEGRNKMRNDTLRKEVVKEGNCSSLYTFRVNDSSWLLDDMNAASERQVQPDSRWRYALVRFTAPDRAFNAGVDRVALPPNYEERMQMDHIELTVNVVREGQVLKVTIPTEGLR